MRCAPGQQVGGNCLDENRRKNYGPRCGTGPPFLIAMYLFTREEILGLLKRTVEGLVSRAECEERLAYLYLHREPYPILDLRDTDYYDEILYQLGYTADNLSEE